MRNRHFQRRHVTALYRAVAFIGIGLSLASWGQADEASPDTAASLSLRQVTPTIFAGATPTGDAHWQELAERSIKTIVSVDGAQPDVATASRFGLKYVHIPIGYDEVPPSAIAAMTRVCRERPSPIFVHCHHGKHRGPTAAALCGMIDGSLDKKQALAVLKQAGTSQDYPGLWESVRSFQPLSPDTPLPKLVAQADVEPLVEMMVRVDEQLDQLEISLSQARSVDHSRQTAVLLHEEFREASRLLADDQQQEFMAELKSSKHKAEAIVSHLHREDMVAAGRSLTRLKQSCTDCHRRFRN